MPSTVSARTSASPAPTRASERERLLAERQRFARSARPASARAASDPSAYARSGDGGSAGTSRLPARARRARRRRRRSRRGTRRGARAGARPACGSSAPTSAIARRRARPRAARRRPGWRARRRGRRAPPRSSPRELRRRPARRSHRASARSRWAQRLREAEDGLAPRAAAATEAASASRAATRRAPSAARARPVRRRRRAPARRRAGACSHSRSPGRIVRVDRLREQRMAEAEPPARPVGDEHAVLDRRAQRLAHVAARAAPRRATSSA